MPSLHRFWLTLMVTCLPAMAGCFESAPPAGVTPPGTSAAPAQQARKPQSIPETADAAILAVVEGLKAGDAHALWEFFPSSYQRDINDAARAFAGRMDDELWARGVAVLRRVATVLKEKRGLLLEGGFLRQPGADREMAEADLDSLLALLDTLLASDLASLESLREADVGEMLARTGGRLIEQLKTFSRLMPRDPEALDFNDLSRLQVHLKKTEGDRAVVTISPPNEPPRDVEFTRIEGKWIPRELADNWIERVGQARARLATISGDALGEVKPQILAAFAAVDQLLDNVASARDKAELAVAIQEGAQAIIPMAAAFASAAPADQADAFQPAANDEAKDLVTVVVTGKLDSDTQDALFERLQAAVVETPQSAAGDPGRVFAEYTADDETLTVRVGPVADVEEFANRLDFLSITAIDAATRTITARKAD